jgi:murein DD-endopeptidase MepM/ murein hydrolase activator NlpD
LTHQGNQRYAFDFDLGDGEDSYAARGGTVTYVRESLWKNSTPGSGQWEPANALRIEHQDGTVSLYFHMQQWGVIPDLGDRIHRGDPVGITGNTGNSTGSHLHYQVNLDAGTKQSIPIRFHVTDVLDIQTPCYTPQQDDFVISDNA